MIITTPLSRSIDSIRWEDVAVPGKEIAAAPGGLAVKKMFLIFLSRDCALVIKN